MEFRRDNGGMENALIGIAVAAVVAAVGLAFVAVRMRLEAARWRFQFEAAKHLDEDAERMRRDNIDAVREAAKSASLEAAQSVSSKLLEDHKRETDAAREAGVKQTRETSESLTRNFRELADIVVGLHAQLKEKGEAVDTLWRALENPGSAGAMAEIGLANTLKNFGLETPRDYLLQHTTADEETGKRLRPDAVVFLPGDGVLVIDCKASKFLLEIARADGTDDETTAYANFGRTMNQHLKALTEKDYRSAIVAARRQAGYADAPLRVHMFMFLPNDAAMGKLAQADAAFRDRAREQNIIVGGPDVLHCALSLASNDITLARQVENHEKIIQRTGRLLDGVSLALGKAADVGRNLKRAADSFDEFGRSVNRSLLPNARGVVQLGVQPNKPLPGPMPAFSVHAEENVIEGEAEELPLPASPPRLVQ